MNKKIITYKEAIAESGAFLSSSAAVGNKNRTAIFKTGCFDIVHPGHIKTFELAKTIGDILIVGIGSDAFITQYKKAPVFDQKTRAEWVAAIGCVDYVVILDENPDEWQGTIDHVGFLTRVRPHYYFLPYDDQSIHKKIILAHALDIKVKIQKESDDFYTNINGQQTKISSSTLKTVLCQQQQ